MDDVQDPDEDIGGYDEESEEDEGSLYAPTEATSELGVQEANEVEESMQLSHPDPCAFLLLLPRELRDKVCGFNATISVRANVQTICSRIQIYGYALCLGTPISDRRTRLHCLTCPYMDSAAEPISQSQVYEGRNLLRTCRQIRDEGTPVFFEVNSWKLHRVRLRDLPMVPSSIPNDTQHMFDQLGQIKAMKHFKHVNMRIPLAPLAYCDLSIPHHIALDDPLAIFRFDSTHSASVLASHKLDETAQCGLFRKAIKSLVANRAHVFPKLRSITLEVSFHSKKITPVGDPLDRCGITLHVRIKLGHIDHVPLTTHDTASVQIVTPNCILHNPRLLQRARFSVQGQNLHPDIMIEQWTMPRLDPRRHMLSPLGNLPGVQSVEVERRWTVYYREPGIKGKTDVIRIRPLRQRWRFRTVGEMLETGGDGLRGFMDPGLQALKISRDDVDDIVENTMEEDFEHHHHKS